MLGEVRMTAGSATSIATGSGANRGKMSAGTEGPEAGETVGEGSVWRVLMLFTKGTVVDKACSLQGPNHLRVSKRVTGGERDLKKRGGLEQQNQTHAVDESYMEAKRAEI